MSKSEMSGGRKCARKRSAQGVERPSSTVERREVRSTKAGAGGTDQCVNASTSRPTSSSRRDRRWSGGDQIEQVVVAGDQANEVGTGMDEQVEQGGRAAGRSRSDCG